MRGARSLLFGPGPTIGGVTGCSPGEEGAVLEPQIVCRGCLKSGGPGPQQLSLRFPQGTAPSCLFRLGLAFCSFPARLCAAPLAAWSLGRSPASEAGCGHRACIAGPSGPPWHRYPQCSLSAHHHRYLQPSPSRPGSDPKEVASCKVGPPPAFPWRQAGSGLGASSGKRSPALLEGISSTAEGSRSPHLPAPQLLE